MVWPTLIFHFHATLQIDDKPQLWKHFKSGCKVILSQYEIHDHGLQGHFSQTVYLFIIRLKEFASKLNVPKYNLDKVKHEPMQPAVTHI